jgi:toxin HigB-1
MKISFRSKKLEKLCCPNSSKKLQKAHGRQVAKALHRLLADLTAAANLGELPPFARPHPLKGSLKGKLSLELPDGKRLLLTAEDDPPPTHADGSLNWHAVSHIQISAIQNYHHG